MRTFQRPSFIGAMASWILAAAALVFGFTLWGGLFPRLASDDTWGFLPLFLTFGLFIAGLVLFLVWLTGLGAGRQRPAAEATRSIARAQVGRPLRRWAIASWTLAALAFVFSLTVSPYLSNGTFRDFVPILLAAAAFVVGVALFVAWGAQRQRA